MNAQSAVSTAEEILDCRHVSGSHPEPTLQYFVLDDGTLALTYAFQVNNETTGAWYEAFVDAHSGQLLSVTDFVTHATVSPSNIAIRTSVTLVPSTVLFLYRNRTSLKASKT